MDFFYFDSVQLVKWAGLVGVFVIIFAESGLLIGFFLPGDSLLFAAGFLASQGYMSIAVLIAVCFSAAVLGDSLGYGLGKRFGSRVFRKEDSLFFRKEHLQRAQRFFEDHGGKTIIYARFIPVVRTFAPLLAGVGMMKYSYFLAYNLIGGALWAIGLPLLGFWLGGIVPDADKFILPVILGIVIISILPNIIYLLTSRKNRRRLKEFVQNAFSFYGVKNKNR